MLALKISRPNEVIARDRRSGRDRRNSQRFAVNIEIVWESLIGQSDGTISDVSTTGCFILCTGEVEDSETIKIYLPLVDGQHMILWGEVVNHVYEIGFAVRFIEIGDTEKLFLEKLTGKLSQRPEASLSKRRG
ncbi:MAG: PilZ domain-containing protein [Pyrinomonadaceae bacterium]|nr:PilZ domain-containing protein [Pyrinomonadaceae bacterium]